MFEGTDSEVREWIQSRAVDVGVVVLPADEFATIPIAEDEFLAVVAANHALTKHSQIEIRQLAQEPFIMSKAGCKPSIMNLFRKAKVTPKTQFEVMDLRTIFAMIQEGMGVTIAPEMALPSDLTELHLLPLQPRKFRHLALAVPSLETATPAVAAFLQEAQGAKMNAV